jgi:hypothetical protein
MFVHGAEHPAQTAGHMAEQIDEDHRLLLCRPKHALPAQRKTIIESDTQTYVGGFQFPVRRSKETILCFRQPRDPVFVNGGRPPYAVNSGF